MSDNKQKDLALFLEEILVCCICNDILHDAHTLQQCLHTVCKRCLDGLLLSIYQDSEDDLDSGPPGVIRCPMCRKLTLQDQIKRNFFINELVERWRSSSVTESDEDTKCGQCDEESHMINSATCRCMDCHMALCESCRRVHLKIEALKGHKIIDLEMDDLQDLVVDQVIICHKHPAKALELYCKPCGTSICVMCKATAHEGHMTETISEALERIIPEMREALKNLEKTEKSLRNTVRDIEENMKSTDFEYSVCSKLIDSTAEVQINSIKSEQMKLNTELTVRKKIELKKLEDFQNAVKQRQLEHEGLIQAAKVRLRCARNGTLLTELSQGDLKCKIDKIRQIQLPFPSAAVSMPKLKLCNVYGKKIGGLEFTSKSSFLANVSSKLNTDITYANISRGLLNSIHYSSNDGFLQNSTNVCVFVAKNSYKYSKLFCQRSWEFILSPRDANRRWTTHTIIEMLLIYFSIVMIVLYFVFVKRLFYNVFWY